MVTSEWLSVQPSASTSAPDSALESSLQRTMHSSFVPLTSARTVVVPLPTAVMVPLEVTESAMISDDAVISVLQEFYRYGFRIEIDDFGKAQSTLPMLKLPFVDTVKLDKSLIDCIGDRKGEIMLRQVVRLCYELGLYTTAEGVEAEDQVDFLRALDCTDIQGYFFSPPLPVEKYTEKLRQQARKRA